MHACMYIQYVYYDNTYICKLFLFVQLSLNLALVLLHDLLYGKGVKCGGPLKYSVMRHRGDLRRSLRALDQHGEGEISLCKSLLCSVYIARKNILTDTYL